MFVLINRRSETHLEQSLYECVKQSAQYRDRVVTVVAIKRFEVFARVTLPFPQSYEIYSNVLSLYFMQLRQN